MIFANFFYQLKSKNFKCSKVKGRERERERSPTIHLLPNNIETFIPPWLPDWKFDSED